MADELQISGVYNSFSIDSSLPMSSFGLSSPTMDWNQPFFPGASSGRDMNNFHAVAPEDLSSKPYFQQEEPTGSNQALLQGDFVDQMNQGVLWDGQCRISGEEPGDSISPSTFLGGLLEPADLTTAQLSTYDRCQALSCRTSVMESYNRLSSEEVSPIQWSEFQHHNVPLSSASTEAWLQTSSPSTHIYAAQFHPQESEKRSGATTIKAKPKLEDGRNSSSTVKKTSNEPVAKKPRIEMPSPLPTFNVRKEKLQDRVTALQQLVSPFGKTDTASVLYEAIEYIKFLHNQVNTLSTPYLRSGRLMQHQQNPSDHNLKDGEGPKQDLRSRGLCLVPISSTIPVAIEPSAELWIPPLCNSYNR